MDATRMAYLDALGIPVWQRRPPPPSPDRLQLGPGQGDHLMLCEDQAATAGPLASDLLRWLGADSAWAWPLVPGDDAGSGAGESLDELLDRGSFSTVVVFGEVLAGRLFHGAAPSSLNGAVIVLSSDLASLATSAKARRELWRRYAAARQG